MKYILLLCFTTNLFAQDFFPVKKGDPSPVDGFAISRETEKQVRQKVMDLEFKSTQLTQLGVLKDDQIRLLEAKSSLQADHNKELMGELKSSNNWLKTTGFFLLGGVVATVVAYGAAHAVK